MESYYHSPSSELCVNQQKMKLSSWHSSLQTTALSSFHCSDAVLFVQHRKSISPWKKLLRTVIMKVASQSLTLLWPSCNGHFSRKTSSQTIHLWSSFACSEKNPLNISGMVCVGWMSFLPTNHQCQSTGGDKKCFNLALFFFIHNWTPNERGNSSFTTLLQYQQQITKALNHKNIKHN